MANWPSVGVNANSTQNSRFEDLQVIDNGNVGLIGGNGANIINCIASFNDDSGIVAVESIISGCTTMDNGQFGISAIKSLIKGNTVWGNAAGTISHGNTGLVIENNTQ